MQCYRPLVPSGIKTLLETGETLTTPALLRWLLSRLEHMRGVGR